MNAPTEPTSYETFGGRDFFTRLVAAFYSRVANDDVLRPMYPPGSLDAAQWRLRSFLEQYWGGPTDYSDERGHPRLRMRHAAFSIDSTARDRWLTHMRAAVDEQDLASKLADDLRAGDLVVCLGAGDITQWAAGLADGIARASTA